MFCWCGKLGLFTFKDEYYNRPVCKNCWKSIDDFHRFYCMVERHHPQPEPTAIKVEMLEECEIDSNDPLRFNCSTPKHVFGSESDAPERHKRIGSDVVIDVMDGSESIKTSNNHCDQQFDTMDSLANHLSANLSSNVSTESEEEAQSAEKDPLETKNKRTNSSPEEITEQEKLILKFTKFGCVKCDYVAKSFVDLKNHGGEEHKTNLSLVSVLCCGKLYNSRLRLYNHCLTHIDPDRFKCDICGKTYQEKNTLISHKLRVHAPILERPFKCGVCGAAFAKQRLLKQHANQHRRKRSSRAVCVSPVSKKPRTVRDPKPEKNKMKIEVVNDGEIHIWDQSETNAGTTDAGLKPVSDPESDSDSESDMALSKLKEVLKTDRKMQKRPDFTCYNCHVENPKSTVKFSSFTKLTKHSYDVHGKKPAMYCSICDHRFLTVGGLVRDYANHTGTPIPFRHSNDHLKECLECKLLFKNEDIYQKHMMMNHTSEDQKNFKCNLCPKAFPLEVLLQCHINWHKDVQQKNHYCTECDQYFLTEGKLKEHNDGCHGPLEKRIISAKYIKPIDYRYRKLCTTEEIAQQERFIHKYVKLSCEKCKHVAKTFATLRKHYKIDHGLRSLAVTCCKRRYTSRIQLYEHCLTHKDPEHFKCKVCAKVLTNGYILETHMWACHTPISKRPFKCDVCGDAFMKDHLLRAHINHHLARVQKKHFCKECNLGFEYASTLELHMERVHSQGTFLCSICDKQFGDRKTLNAHRETHSKKELEWAKVQCEQCGRWLLHQASLRKHKNYGRCFVEKVEDCETSQ